MSTYFGYGAMANTEVIRAVIGRIPKGIPATLQDVALCVQGMENIPEAARALLRRRWPETFRSYTLISRPGSKVSGIAWEVTELEREAISSWELIDLGWYEVRQVTVQTPDGKSLSASTEFMHGEQSYVSEANGMLYPQLLNGLPDTLRIAGEVRDERTGKASAPVS